MNSPFRGLLILFLLRSGPHTQITSIFCSFPVRCWTISFPNSGIPLGWSVYPPPSLRHVCLLHSPALLSHVAFPTWSPFLSIWSSLKSGWEPASVPSLSCCFPGVCSLLGPQWVLCPVCWWPHSPHSWLLHHHRKTGWRTGYSAQVSSEYDRIGRLWFGLRFGGCEVWGMWMTQETGTCCDCQPVPPHISVIRC